MRNIFLEKSYTKCGGKTIPRPFSKKSKLGIFMDRQSVYYKFAFILWPNRGPPKYIKTKVLNTFFYLI